MKIILPHGPIIPNILAIAFAADIIVFTFSTHAAAAIAHLATGWDFHHDDRTLAAPADETALTLAPSHSPASPISFNSWSVADDHLPVVQ